MARVRIVPGTGQWVINGRTLEDYFPNRVHQQIVNEPFKAVDAEGLYDVVANPDRRRRWRAKRARCVSASLVRSTRSTKKSTVRR